MLFTQIKRLNLSRISFLLLSISMLLSFTVLAGWLFQQHWLVSHGAAMITTKFNTALCFLLAGTAFLFIVSEKWVHIGLLLTAIILLISCITISEYLFHWNAGIDELFIKDHFTILPRIPGRMSIGTAMQFILMSFVLISIAFKKEQMITEILIIPIWAVSFIILVGYLYEMGKPFSFSGYSKVSPVAVLIIFLFSSAVFSYNPRYGYLTPFTKKTTAAKVNRRALIVSIILTMLFGWLRLQGELEGLYMHDFGIALMGVFFVLLLLYTSRVNTIKLNEAEEKINGEKNLIESMLNSIPGIFFLFDKNGRFIRKNKQYETVTGYEKEEIEQMSPLDFFEGNDKKKIQEQIRFAFEKGSSSAEADFCTKSGKKIPMFFTSVFMNYDGQPCIVGTGIDISERKIAEHEVQLVNGQLRELTKHMEHLRENERLSIAREIHDELGQQLSVLKMNLSWLKENKQADEMEKNIRLEKMIQLSEDSINTIRKISSDLRPPVINDLGIAEALKLYAKEFSIQTGIKVNFYTELEMLHLSTTTATALYRIFQESLTNILRYAEANIIEASLDMQEGELILSVSDNGKGFPIEELLQRKTLGVIGMRERAFMIGGNFTIHSEPGEGTHVQVTVSLENDL